MLSKLRSRLTYANVVATMALFVALGGTAYAVNTVGSSDIIDGQVKTADIGNGEVGSADVKDNSLNTFDVHSFLGVDIVDGSLDDQDVGQGTFVNFAGEIGTVPAHGCVDRAITGINAQNDHLVLTPANNDSSPGVVYDILFSTADEFAVIHACNATGSSINDATTHFNLLVFDAQ